MTREMRRKDREVTDINELKEIINLCKVCRIAFHDEEGLYIVPMNFGYSCENDHFTFYFHSAKKGRKLDAIVYNSEVCLEMDCEHRLIEAEAACGYGFAFKSIVANGTASIIPDGEEKKKALILLMKHQSGKDFTFTEAMQKAVEVFKIEVDRMTGKWHK